MMKIFFTTILALIVLSAAANLVSSENSDEVNSLPGLNFKINFNHFSGYLETSNNSFLHYWFFESQRDPANDPLILWLNGGPGCSSLLGALTEQGPFRVENSQTLSLNKYAWNGQANIIFLEAPAGVGFSYKSDKNYATNDDQTAENNFLALKSFFKKYPQYLNHDFYITGESYAGIYVPTLSVLVLDRNYPANFKGFAIGNGYLDVKLNGNSVLHFLYSHSFFDDYLWDGLIEACCKTAINNRECDFQSNHDPECRLAINKITKTISNIRVNPYNIYDQCSGSSLSSRSSNKTLQGFVNSREYFDKKMIPFNLLKTSSGSKNKDPPCTDESVVADWLNQNSVRKALHISPEAQPWSSCSDQVSAHYKQIYQTMSPQVKHLIDSGLKGLIYNGDVDSMCNYIGDRWFVENLGYKATKSYSQWLLKNQVGGFEKRYGKLTYTTVRGAGHMVPTDRPEQAQYLLHRFISE